MKTTVVKRRSGRRPKAADVEAEPKRRTGRPMKLPSGKRDQVTILLRSDIKRRLIEAAQEHGRTLSAEGEVWLERLLTYESTFAQMRKNLEDIEKDSVEAALWRIGYRPIRTTIDGKVWKSWAEPGYPGIESSGFIP
jgi:hypothetical protein